MAEVTDEIRETTHGHLAGWRTIGQRLADGKLTLKETDGSGTVRPRGQIAVARPVFELRIGVLRPCPKSLGHRFSAPFRSRDVVAAVTNIISLFDLVPVTVGAPTARIVIRNLGCYSGLLETTQLVLGGLDAGNWIRVSMNFLPLAALAPEDQRDPKRYRGWRLTTDRCLRMLRADNVTQIGTNAGSADV